MEYGRMRDKFGAASYYTQFADMGRAFYAFLGAFLKAVGEAGIKHPRPPAG